MNKFKKVIASQTKTIRNLRKIKQGCNSNGFYGLNRSINEGLESAYDTIHFYKSLSKLNRVNRFNQ